MSIATHTQVGVWRVIGREQDIPTRGARTVETERGTIAVFKTGDGTVYAVDDRCPHKGGPLSEGIVSGSRVTCPLHGLRLCLKTGAAVSPDTGRVARYAVRIDNGLVYLDLSRRVGIE